MLFAIGAGTQVVGRTKFCNYPPKAKALPEIGGFSAKTIGRNGAGKTTVLRAWANLLAPNTGVVWFDDKDVGTLTPAHRARAIALVPQVESHAWALTVQEMVELGRAAHRGWFLPLTPHDRAVVARACPHAVERTARASSRSTEAVLTPEYLRAAFGVHAELYRDPQGQWALSVRTARGVN